MKEDIKDKKLAKQIYRKKYDLEHPDKVKQWNKNNYLKHKEQRLKKQKEYYYRNRDKISKKIRKKLENLKSEFIQKLGGKCCICGYNKCNAALDFHHTKPIKKGSSINRKGLEDPQSKQFDITKVILVCSNCHREIHMGLYPQFIKKDIN